VLLDKFPGEEINVEKVIFCSGVAGLDIDFSRL
jgi:hypothetical protein